MQHYWTATARAEGGCTTAGAGYVGGHTLTLSLSSTLLRRVLTLQGTVNRPGSYSFLVNSAEE